MARPTSHWFNPATKVYKYNYGFGINYYQPMVDYIDAKSKGRHTNYPHLPWTDERGLEQYNPSGLIRSYSERDLSTISRQTEARAKTRLKDFKATTKNQFDLAQSVSAATITRKIRTEEKKSKKRQILRQIDEIKAKLSDKVESEDELTSRIESSMKSIKNYMHGKSAKAIEDQLLAESRSHIAKGHEMDVEEMYQSQMSKSLKKVKLHAKLMDEKMEERLEESYVKPLSELSDELRSFNRKATLHYMDTR